MLNIFFNSINSAKALQTVFKILSPSEFHLDAETSRKFATRDFGVKEATQVMKKILLFIEDCFHKFL